MKKLISIDNAYTDMRVDRFLRSYFNSIPQSLIEKYLRNGKIKINKKKIKNSYKLKFKDQVELHNINFKSQPENKKIKFEPSRKIIKENEELIIENNENFIVINKKAGISVQGGTKSKKNIIDIFSKSDLFINSKPFSVHRLDKDTSGVFIIAKNRSTAQFLTSLFRLRKIHKTYLAICHGVISKKSGVLKNELIRYENKKQIVEKAITNFNIIDKNQSTTLVQLNPITGRKHQLRKQLYEIGHPIYGDDKYKLFSSSKSQNKKLMLHSFEIKFIMNNNKFTFRASLPNYFKMLLDKKRIRYLNI